MTNASNKLIVDISKLSIAEQNSVSSIKFSLNSGELMHLDGRSGSGKTSVLNALFGLNDHYKISGTVKYIINGNNFNQSNIGRTGLLGVLGQDDTLLPWLNVRENFILPSNLNSKITPPSQNEIDVVIKMLFRTNENVLEKKPSELSTGQKQRACLARVLVQKPVVIFLDEVFNGLDAGIVEIVWRVIIEYMWKNNAIIIFVSHQETVPDYAGDYCLASIDRGVFSTTLKKRPDR